MDKGSGLRRDIYVHDYTQQSREREINAPGGILARNLSERASERAALDRAATVYEWISFGRFPRIYVEMLSVLSE